MNDWFTYIVELIFGCGMFFNASLFIPQIIKIYKMKNFSGLSLTTFAGFNVVQFFSILHGYLHRDWLFMCGMAISFILCGTVTIGIYLHGDDSSSLRHPRGRERLSDKEA
ncbi:MAG: hypothetical protein LBL99_00645 [Holosporaceae bacterium]|jgi:MtN3 and saliva related transmembrane protein|nr:hypothetical protein [Holosporaceae bacterium]